MHGVLSENDQIALYLERARLLIDDPDKWLQREYKKGDRRCAIQAIRDAIGVDDCDMESNRLYTGALLALAGVYDYREDSPESAICNRNDAFEHHHEVMSYFDMAITKVRSLSLLRTSV